MPILFDLDDTLLDDRGAQDVYLAELFDTYAHDLPHDSPSAFVVAWRAAIELYFERYARGELTMAEQRRARIRDVFGRSEMPDSTADAIIAEFVARYAAAWRLSSDALQVLDQLSGSVLGVITNGSHDQQLKKLRSTGILDRFSVVVVSEAVGHAKPAREIFEYACARLRCAPSDCVFVGDDWRRDVLGATAAGMTPIWLNPAEQAVQREGVLTISTLAELMQRPDARNAIDRARG